MFLQFTLLLTLGFLGQNDQPQVSDQLQHSSPFVVKVYTRLLERVGSRIRISGLDQEVTVSANVTLPKIGSQPTDSCLSLQLLNRGDHFEVIACHGEIRFEAIREEQLKVRTQSQISGDWATVESIERFLVRESALEQRWDLWKSFHTDDPKQQIRWLKLGGDYFSGLRTFSRLIDDSGLKLSAGAAGLHPYQTTWISNRDLAKFRGLGTGPHGYLAEERIELQEQAQRSLSQILEKASRSPENSGVGPGSQRKLIRTEWGEPHQVHWIRHGHYLLEHWDYPDRYARLINGRLYELEKPAEVSLQSP